MTIDTRLDASQYTISERAPSGRVHWVNGLGDSACGAYHRRTASRRRPPQNPAPGFCHRCWITTRRKPPLTTRPPIPVLDHPAGLLTDDGRIKLHCPFHHCEYRATPWHTDCAYRMLTAHVLSAHSPIVMQPNLPYCARCH